MLERLQVHRNNLEKYLNKADRNVIFRSVATGLRDIFKTDLKDYEHSVSPNRRNARFLIINLVMFTFVHRLVE